MLIMIVSEPEKLASDADASSVKIKAGLIVDVASANHDEVDSTASGTK